MLAAGTTLAGLMKIFTMNNQQNNMMPHENHDRAASTENTDTSALYSGESTLQTSEEFEQDKHGDHTEEDNRITAGGVDDIETNSGGAAGTDRAGTTERKAYGDIELNKGLESQATDEES
jgi:hypothetical protein